MSENEKPSIGNAYMNAQGTITLYLRAESGTAIGDGVLTYEPQDKEYQSIIKHLGGINPGEYRPVPPFTNDEPKQK